MTESSVSIGSTCAPNHAIKYEWRCGCGETWEGFDKFDQDVSLRDHAETAHATDEFFDWFLQR